MDTSMKTQQKLWKSV